MSKRYVRLAPYDMRTGALCRRYMVGGCLFKENQWYELDAVWAAKLAALTQGSGHTPVFQVLTAELYGETVRAELAAAYMRGGVSLAMAGALAPPPPGAPPKSGVRTSKFDGMAADEATLAGASSVITTKVLPKAPEPETPRPPESEATATASGDDAGDSGAGEDAGEDAGEVLDLNTLRTHKEVDAIGVKYGVDLSKARTVADKKDVLAKELFTADDE